MSDTLSNGVKNQSDLDASKEVWTLSSSAPKVESILRSLLENIRNGKSPTKEQLGLYTALQSLQEGGDTAGAIALINKQLGEADKAKFVLDSKIDSIMTETRQALDRVKKNTEMKISWDLGPVVSQIFGYQSDFKETSDYDEFLDLLRATVQLSKSGKTAADAAKLTQFDWKAAGHDGQYMFDDGELTEINGFYAHVLNNKLLDRAEQFSELKSGRDLMVALLWVKDASFVSHRGVKRVKYEKSADSKAVGKHIIVEQEGKTDVVDVLFAGKTTPWSIPQVRSILQDHSMESGKISNARIEEVYAMVTGEKIAIATLAEHPEMALKFQKMLSEKINFMTQISQLNMSIGLPAAKLDGSTGLTTILTGNFDAVANREAALLAQNISKIPQGNEAETGKLASMAGRVGLPLLAAALTGGVAVASYENREISNRATFEEIANRYNKDKPLDALIHNIFLGKEYSLRFGENHAIEAYIKAVRAQLATFDSVAQGNFSDANISKLSAEEQPMYRAVQKQYQILINNKVTPEAAKGLISWVFYKTIENDAAKRANSEDWSFRLSLLFIGFAREGVSVDTKYSQNLDLAREGGLKISKMSDGELAKIGSYQFDDKSQKYTLTLTGTTKFDTLPAGVTSETSAKGEVVLSSAEPFKISRIIHRGADNTLTDSGYQIVLGGKKVDKVTTIATPASVAPVNAPMDVKEKRMLEKGLPDALFFLGHVRDLKINHLVELLSKQDFDGAKTYLESITIQLKNGSTGKMETYTTLKKNLLANWDKAASFTTYMYGNRASKSKQEFTQEFVDSKVRKPDVVRAEKRLAAKYGINIEVPESAFSHQANGKIEAKSTEDIFPNQDKTISCFSTPLGGLHRIDTYDNNVTVSSKTVLIDDEAGRSQIFDATLKTTVETKGILAQVAKLNTYLGARGAVTVEQYKAYLVSGDVSKLGVAGLKEEKKPVFFEARAMIQWNVCMNRVHGIGYPVLGFPGVSPQTVSRPLQLDSGTYEGDSLNVPVSTVGDLAVGVNPLVVLSNAMKKNTPENPNTPSGSSTQIETTTGQITAPTTGPIHGVGETIVAPAPTITGTIVAPTVPGGNTGILAGMSAP